MKRMVLLASALMLSGSVNATVYNFDYSYDGADFTAINGSGSIFGSSLAIGDTVNLSIKATGDSYWDVSAAGNLFTGNLGFQEYGTRASSGSYSLFNDGALQRQQVFTVPSQSSVHAGPNYTDFGGINTIDEWNLVATLDGSFATGNTINGWLSHSWNIFGATGGYTQGISFVEVSAVPVPAALPLFASALAVFGLMRRRKNSKLS